MLFSDESSCCPLWVSKQTFKEQVPRSFDQDPEAEENACTYRFDHSAFVSYQCYSQTPTDRSPAYFNDPGISNRLVPHQG